MDKSLLIAGAGIYGLVAKEIAESMNCFDRIDFIDDGAQQAPDGAMVIGTTKDLEALSGRYADIIVAIGNPAVRMNLIQRIEKNPRLTLRTLVSPKAYISPSARMEKGCIIEPMAVVHAGCILGKGCLVCAGAVINHAAVCGDCIQVDCNATVAGNATVPSGTKIPCNTVYNNA
ncbi:MAG: hypothetical protein IJE62_02090 [Clostridia bacterium]|nr:hypothetical protein [Clostridia bacterium]MBQ7095787.1 hypothetical protein [Clostridia bacterium]